MRYTRAEVDRAEAVMTWHGELIKSYAIQAASEKITRLAGFAQKMEFRTK